MEKKRVIIYISRRLLALDSSEQVNDKHAREQ